MDEARKQIAELGGSAKISKMLGYSFQRVNNWKRRGIPPAVKLNHPDVFLNKNKSKKAA